MSILALFVSPVGRIGQGGFWLGFIGVWVLAALATFAPRPANEVIVLLLLWPQFCVFIKRLHDKGHSGWRLLIPIALNTVLAVMTAVTGVLAFGFAFSNSSAYRHAHPVSVPPFWLAALVGMLAILIYNVIYVLWLGVTAGQPGANRFGPRPGTEPAAAPPG